jgi:hypothetical protein
LAANLLHRIELATQVDQPPLNPPAIRFQLRFARTSCADAAAQLRHGLAPPSEPGQHVFQLRQLHLQLALAGSRVAGKNVQNQLRPVQHQTGELAFQIPQLSRAQIVVENHQVRLVCRGNSGDLFDFSGADQGRRIRLAAPLQHLRHDLAASAFHQLAKLHQRRIHAQLSGGSGEVSRRQKRRLSCFGFRLFARARSGECRSSRTLGPRTAQG